ncbi:MAG TPA: hypothetical protein VGM80_14955 [Gaiellaceae bacterium]|jgi:hypothetical protein
MRRRLPVTISAIALLSLFLAATQPGSAAEKAPRSLAHSTPGPTGAYEIYRDRPLLLPGARATVATLHVPAGSYSITAKTVLGDDASGNVYVFCYLNVNGPDDEDSSAAMLGRNSARVTVPLELTHKFSGAGTIALSCEPTRPTSSTDVAAEMTRIVAVRVDSLTRTTVAG